MKKALTATVIWSTFVLGALLGLAWPVVEPVAIAEGEVCFRCSRVIADGRLAAEMFDGTMPTKYKTAGCLARYLVSHPAEGADLFVTDYTSGRLVDPQRVLFVPVTINDRTNEHDYRAYLSHAEAAAAAHSLNVATVEWTDVLEGAKVQVSTTLAVSSTD
jgi:hypothetical protein